LWNPKKSRLCSGRSNQNYLITLQSNILAKTRPLRTVSQWVQALKKVWKRMF